MLYSFTLDITLAEQDVKYMLDSLPLTKWNQIKAELVEMFSIVKTVQELNLSVAKGLDLTTGL
jgi:hypothetical protein